MSKLREYKQANYGKLTRQAAVRGMTPIEYVNWLIEDAGSKAAAARQAGVTRPALYNWLRRHAANQDE